MGEDPGGGGRQRQTGLVGLCGGSAAPHSVSSCIVCYMCLRYWILQQLAGSTGGWNVSCPVPCALYDPLSLPASLPYVPVCPVLQLRLLPWPEPAV